MATVGNNILAKNSRLRDAFMCDSEDKYNEQLLEDISRGKRVDMISGYSVGSPLVMKLYEAVLDKLSSRCFDTVTMSKYMVQLRYLLHIYKGEPQGQNLANDYRMIYRIDNEVKVLLSETIIEFVEMGLFTEEQMEFVENQLNIMLGSIEDLHQELIREKSYPEMER